MEQINLKSTIKAMAKSLGAAYLGVTSAEAPKHFDHYIRWTEKGYAGSMWYLTEKKRMEKRGALGEVFPGVKSVLVAAFSYKPENDQHPTNAKFARYGWGKDYHLFVKRKLEALVHAIEKEIGISMKSRIYVDTGPILEKSLAERAGVGWIGKNTCLINQKSGSYLYLGEILTDLELEPDQSAKNHCGSCTKCLDACPTNAFVAPYQMDATKCISYHTIESKNLGIPDSILQSIKNHKVKFNSSVQTKSSSLIRVKAATENGPEHPLANGCEDRSQVANAEMNQNRHFGLDGWVAGCDICQEVCPWNQKAPSSELEEITPGNYMALSLEKILELTQEKYDQLFATSSFQRIPLKKLKANARLNLEIKK